MRTYVRETAVRWAEFQRSHHEIAEELKHLVLGVCCEMNAEGRKKQIEAMLASTEFARLREIALQHDSSLHIREHSDRELALWVRTICFCHVMGKERVV